MNPLEILARHYDPKSELYCCLVVHSVLVARRARQIAEDYLERYPASSIDMEFLTEGALLHDLGIGRCAMPNLPSEGAEPYVRHGLLGKEVLEAEGFPRHALVCERHTGAGITKEEVLAGGLPLPPRDYLPVTLEEKIICVADKYFSKTPSKLWKKEKNEKVEKSLGKYGPAVLERWLRLRAEILGR